MNATQVSKARQLDQLLGIINRNQYELRLYGGECRRNAVLESQAEAARLIEKLGPQGLEKAGYARRSTTAATLNAALERQHSMWRERKAKSKLFNPVLLVKGGAL